MYLQPYSVLEKLTHIQTLNLTKFLMCSVDLNMGTNRGTTHIKRIFSFWAGSISLVTYSAALMILSCNSFTFCTFLGKQLPLQTSKINTKRKKRVKSGDRWGQGMGHTLPAQRSGKPPSRNTAFLYLNCAPPYFHPHVCVSGQGVS
jgi:hypothetical protein